MTDTATNPETGVDGSGDAAPTDDIDTEAFDRAPAPEDAPEDADPAKAEADGEDGEPEAKPDADKPADDDSEEVEVDGATHRIPKALKGAFMMQADYTAKTTKLSEDRRALESEQATWAAQREESRAALPEEHTRVAVLSHTLEQAKAALEQPVDKAGLKLGQIDWIAFRQSAAGDEEMTALYQDLRSRYDAARETVSDLSDQLGAAKTDLSTKEADRLKTQRETAQADLAKRQQETGQALAKDMGWTKDQLAEGLPKIATFMASELGVTAEELAEATDHRVWRMAHRLMTAEARVATLEKATKQQDTAKNHEKAQQTKPVEGAKGSGGNARDPATARGDGLSTGEWMKRRNAQDAKRRS